MAETAHTSAGEVIDGMVREKAAADKDKAEVFCIRENAGLLLAAVPIS